MDRQVDLKLLGITSSPYHGGLQFDTSNHSLFTDDTYHARKQHAGANKWPSADDCPSVDGFGTHDDNRCDHDCNITDEERISGHQSLPDNVASREPHFETKNNKANKASFPEIGEHIVEDDDCTDKFYATQSNENQHLPLPDNRYPTGSNDDSDQDNFQVQGTSNGKNTLPVSDDHLHVAGFQNKNGYVECKLENTKSNQTYSLQDDHADIPRCDNDDLDFEVRPTEVNGNIDSPVEHGNEDGKVLTGKVTSAFSEQNKKRPIDPDVCDNSNCPNVKKTKLDTTETLDGSLKIQRGSTFESYAHVQKAIQTFQTNQFVQLYKRSSRGLKGYAKKCPKKKLNSELLYSEIDYACIHGGRKFKSQSKGKRPDQQ